MNLVVQSPDVAQNLIEERRAKGLDRPDEVWDGTYIIMPDPNIEHQMIVTKLGSVFTIVASWGELGEAFAGTNVSDQPPDLWTTNYRCPDVAVFLNGTTAIPRDTHWFGGPDFAVEVVSPYDRTQEKLDFYARVGTRELLIIDRDPWALELFRLSGDELQPAGRAEPDSAAVIESDILPLTFELIPGPERPAIRLKHRDGKQEWLV